MTPPAWNRAVLAHAPASGAFLQSHEWGAFQQATGREVRRYESGDVVAQAVTRPLPGGFFGWDAFRCAGNGALREKMVGDLRTTRGIFLHVEPATTHVGVENFQPLRPASSRQPQHTAIVDLAQTEDALLAAMHPKTRYNLRLAQKHGVAVRLGTGADFAAAWKIFAATATRDRFSLHARPYYETMLASLGGPLADGGRASAHLVLAEHEGDLLAALLLLRFGDTATYLHGASGDAKRNLMAPYALHAETMRFAKAAGCTAYDLWGVAPDNAPANHPWAGITRFKTGFGGRRVNMPGAGELPLRPFWYTLYRLIKSAHP